MCFCHLASATTLSKRSWSLINSTELDESALVPDIMQILSLKKREAERKADDEN